MQNPAVSRTACIISLSDLMAGMATTTTLYVHDAVGRVSILSVASQPLQLVCRTLRRWSWWHQR